LVTFYRHQQTSCLCGMLEFSYESTNGNISLSCARLAQFVSAFSKPRLDSDHILTPITIHWFAGVSIMWPAAPHMLRCLWT
jgi:hypothetical protein